MNLAVLANIWDCPYFNDWKAGIANQIDMDFEIIYYDLEHMNSAIGRVIDDYGGFLFLDIDDIPQPALVSAAKRYAKEYEVVGFGMRLIGEMSGLFGMRSTGELGEEYYCHGFWNTYYNSLVLRALLPLTTDYDTIKRAAQLGALIGFESLPLIHYRQYGQNKNLVEIDGRYVWKV